VKWLYLSTVQPINPCQCHEERHAALYAGMNEKTLIAGYPVTERVGLKNQLQNKPSQQQRYSSAEIVLKFC